MSVFEQKKEFNEKLRELFVRNEQVEEEMVKRMHPSFHQQALKIYGSWKKSLRLNDLKKRKMNERQKFYLYFIMKKRYEEHGEEALRPKNIDLETKEKIVDSYKTLKALRSTITTWGEEKVLLEVRKAVLTGIPLNELEERKKDLYKKAMEYYEDFEHLKDEYEEMYELKKFPEKEEKEEKEETSEKEQGKIVEMKTEGKTNEQKKEEKSKENQETYKDVDKFVTNVLKEMHYFDDTEVANALHRIIEGSHMKKEQVVNDLLSMMTEARQKGEILTEEKIAEERPDLYQGFKKHFKNLREAFEEVTKSLFA